jgi:hypothetical protein
VRFIFKRECYASGLYKQCDVKIKEKLQNASVKVISNSWGTLEHINFDFTFKSEEAIN